MCFAFERLNVIWFGNQVTEQLDIRRKRQLVIQIHLNYVSSRLTLVRPFPYWILNQVEPSDFPLEAKQLGLIEVKNSRTPTVHVTIAVSRTLGTIVLAKGQTIKIISLGKLEKLIPFN
ncbi:hypothetical protein ABEB36_000870 [Hypothenemus hampei]|uniref:Uncharacterized protein n=1 Tax=Hypothenemus hampei TaxID=57062 RepID=A0ABD1FDI6_HYPHA